MKNKKEEEQKPVENHEDQALVNLLKVGGMRPVVPNDVRARVRDTLHSQWKRATRVRLWRKRFLTSLSAVAVALLLYEASLWLIARDLPDSMVIGFVENRNGTVLSIQDGSGESKSQVLTKGESVTNHSWLESSDTGRILVHLLNGATVRLDVNTRFGLESESSFVLDRGTIYIDSEGTGAKLAVATRYGTVRNRGTQFEIKVDTENIRIRVREGSIVLHHNGSEETAAAGTQLSYNDAGKSSRVQIASYSPTYLWLSEIAPTFHLEGSSLTDFLEWISRENGWKIEYLDPGIRSSAPQIMLHGSVQGLPSHDIPGVVLPVCGLSYQLEEGTLKINRAR